MKKTKILTKLLWSSLAISPIGTIVSCQSNSINYDLGLVTEPINSLNYIKFDSVKKILPSLVESPLKSGPSESLKLRLNLPEIPMGIYGADSNSNNMEEFLENHRPPSSSSGRYYSLDQFGSTTGNLSSDRSVYQPVSLIMTPSNNILSMNILLNEGESKWSNNDVVTADDYIDAMHYILDLSTGSQRQISIIQNKFRYSSDVVEAQKNYLKKHKKAYQNPFGYPPLRKINNQWEYDFSNYRPWSSQNPNDEKEIQEIKNAVMNLGFKSGRLYWEHSNEEILAAIPYSPDFNWNSDSTIVMLANPEYDITKHSKEELTKIPQRIAKEVHKYLFFDWRQNLNKEKFDALLKESHNLKNKLSPEISYYKNINQYNETVNALYQNNNVLSNDFINNLEAKQYLENRLLAMDEYCLRVEYDDYQPTSLSNAYTNLTSTLTPINRKFVESIGGIEKFGLDANRFLTNGPFYIDDLVLGSQGYISLIKNNQYYTANKTISNRIKIYFSSDQNINAALYDDNYIAATRVPAISQLKYWANSNYRLNMKKSSGFGTIALAFNLDHETNKDSLINDPCLRNAIYYAIDRNAMLNLVGWNSSYPVITWTAFGQGSSSFGDAIEISFDHQQMYPEVVTDFSFKNAIPIQNYSHIDHLSKNYNFEHVDRTDKAYRLDIARAYLEKFKQNHPNISQVTLRYINNSSDEQLNAGLALQDFMKKAFDNYVNIDLKNLPETVYEEYYTTGKYDIIYKNFDTFGTDSYSYIKAFFVPDEIDSESAKKSGFRNNPSGSWTYQKYFSDLGYYYNKETKKIEIDKDKNEWATKKQHQYLEIEDRIWNKMLELSFKKDGETDNEYIKRYMSFLTGQFGPQNNETQKWIEKDVFALIAAYEKIVRDGAPVVPLMEVDTYWEITRVGGVESLYSFALQFAYDMAKPPIPGLPTVNKI